MFVLIVNLKFLNEDDMEIFILNWKQLKKYCDENESSFLLQYELAVSDKEKNHIVIIEKFLNKKFYLDFHKTSRPFLKFRNFIKDLDMEISGNSYNMYI